MSVVLRDLFSVTLYPPHIPLCAIKKKKKKKKNRTSTSNFSQPQPSKNGPWDKQLVFVSKTQIGHINATAFPNFDFD